MQDSVRASDSRSASLRVRDVALHKLHIGLGRHLVENSHLVLARHFVDYVPPHLAAPARHNDLHRFTPGAMSGPFRPISPPSPRAASRPATKASQPPLDRCREARPDSGKPRTLSSGTRRIPPLAGSQRMPPRAQPPPPEAGNRTPAPGAPAGRWRP